MFSAAWLNATQVKRPKNNANKSSVVFWMSLEMFFDMFLLSGRNVWLVVSKTFPKTQRSFLDRIYRIAPQWNSPTRSGIPRGKRI
jgi:hypothetical protein